MTQQVDLQALRDWAMWYRDDWAPSHMPQGDMAETMLAAADAIDVLTAENARLRETIRIQGEEAARDEDEKRDMLRAEVARLIAENELLKSRYATDVDSLGEEKTDLEMEVARFRAALTDSVYYHGCRGPRCEICDAARAALGEGTK